MPETEKDYTNFLKEWISTASVFGDGLHEKREIEKWVPKVTVKSFRSLQILLP
jgi:hypothetical protein